MFLLRGIIIGLMASIPLGPMGLLCIQRTLNNGRWNGIVSGMGVASADTFYAFIAAFGVSAVSNFIEAQQFYLRLIGGGILIGLGLKMFLTNPAIQIRNKKNKHGNLWSDFIYIFLFSLYNPLTVLVFGAIFAGFSIVSTQSHWYNLLQLVVGIFIGALSWWTILVTVVNLFRSKFRLRRLWWLNKIMGAAITLFGLFAFVSVFFFKV